MYGYLSAGGQVSSRCRRAWRRRRRHRVATKLPPVAPRNFNPTPVESSQTPRLVVYTRRVYWSNGKSDSWKLFALCAPDIPVPCVTYLLDCSFLSLATAALLLLPGGGGELLPQTCLFSTWYDFIGHIIEKNGGYWRYMYFPSRTNIILLTKVRESIPEVTSSWVIIWQIFYAI